MRQRTTYIASVQWQLGNDSLAYFTAFQDAATAYTVQDGTVPTTKGSEHVAFASSFIITSKWEQLQESSP